MGNQALKVRELSPRGNIESPIIELTDPVVFHS